MPTGERYDRGKKAAINKDKKDGKLLAKRDIEREEDTGSFWSKVNPFSSKESRAGGKSEPSVKYSDEEIDADIDFLNRKPKDKEKNDNLTENFLPYNEAINAGYEYFNSQERINLFTEQVALVIAEDSSDRLYEELVDTMVLANRLYNTILEKYNDTASARTTAILEELSEKSFKATNKDIEEMNDLSRLAWTAVRRSHHVLKPVNLRCELLLSPGMVS